MKLTVNRNTWRCGDIGVFKNGVGDTLLLNQYHYMCCLGHCALQLGATKEDIKGHCGPSWVTKIDLGPLHKSENGLRSASELAIDAMKINDNSDINNIERERQLIELFAKSNIELVFEGKYNE